MIPYSGLGTDAYDMFAKGCRTGTQMRKASRSSPTVYRGLIAIYARIKANLLVGNASTRMPYFGTHICTCVELILPKGETNAYVCTCACSPNPTKGRDRHIHMYVCASSPNPTKGKAVRYCSHTHKWLTAKELCHVLRLIFRSTTCRDAPQR